MKNFLRVIRTSVLTLSLLTCLHLTPMATKESQAGIIFSPLLFGIVLVYWGLVYNDPFTFLLDADSTQDNSLDSFIAKKYPQIGDKNVIQDLSSVIRTKIGNKDYTPAADGKFKVVVDRETVLNILGPGGLVESNPKLVEQIVTDLR